MNVTKENRITSLDGIRGIAILVVIAFHYINNQLPDNSLLLVQYGKPLLLIKQITYFGWSGVDLFFILSGFLIGNILLKNKESTHFFKTFYIRRFFRIVPVYYLLLIIFLLLTISQFFNANASIFARPIPAYAYFLFIQNFFMAHYNHFGPQALTATWSLCVEEQFYLVIPLLVFVTKNKYAWIFAVAGILLAIVSRMLSTNFYQGYTLLPSRIDTPMVGFLLAWLHQFENYRQWAKNNTRWLWLLIIVIMGLCVPVYVWSDPGVFGHTIIAVLFAVLVMIALYSEKGIFLRLLANPVLLQIGKLSYFIYLFHQVINGLLHLLILKQLTPILDSYLSILITAASFIITFILASLSFKYFEKPLINYAHQYKY